MSLPNTFAELIQNIDQFKDVAIEFRKDVAEWELYPEANIRAYMSGANIEDSDGECGDITFNYTKFDEYNKQYESTNYYDSNQVPCKTAREKGYYKLVDQVYVTLTDDPNKFMKLVDGGKYYEQYLVNRTEKQSYTEYLEQRLAVADG